MTHQTASKVILGSGVIALVAIASVMTLAYWRLVDGATAVAVILAVLTGANGTNTAASAKALPPPRDQATSE